MFSYVNDISALFFIRGEWGVNFKLPVANTKWVFVVQIIICVFVDNEIRCAWDKSKQRI